MIPSTGTGVQLSRRRFIQISVTATGGGAQSPTPIRRGTEAALGAFVRIESDGRVVIGAHGCE